MNVLILGSGGREHALAWRLSQDPQVEKIWVSPGNAGMLGDSETTRIFCTLQEIDIYKLPKWIEDQKISFVVIGPEKYLMEGAVDFLESHDIAVFGPTKAAAFLEGSKVKSKQFMMENGISTAQFFTPHSLEESLEVVRACADWPTHVLKLSGPALGKGVFVCRSLDETEKTLEMIFRENPPGLEDGLVVERGLRGDEVSLFFLCDHDRFIFLASASDHKRLLDHDQGPNTGGMGAFSPGIGVDPEFIAQIEQKFVKPTLQGMIRRGTPYSGVLFLGIMMDEGKPHLLEYNVRFGDPETQAFLPLIEGNLTSILYSISKHEKSLPDAIALSTSKSLHVVKAAKGYPGLFGEKIEKDQAIEISPASIPFTSEGEHHWFYAGVKAQGSTLITSGGRVLGITAVSDSYLGAKTIAYRHIGDRSFVNEHYRNDIGARVWSS